MPGTKGTVLVPASIDPTGKADVSQKLAPYFASLADGWTLKLQPRATYRCEETMTLADASNCVIDMNGGTIKATIAGFYTKTTHGVPAKALNQQRANFSFENCNNCRLTNGTIRGVNTNVPTYQDIYAFQHAVNVQGGSGNEFDHLGIRNVYGDFFAFDPIPGTTKLTTHFWVHDIDAAICGRQGLSFAGSADGIIEDSKFRIGARHAIDFESDRPAGVGGKDTEPIQRIQFRRCQFGPGRFELGFMSIGGLGEICTDIIIGGLLGNPQDGNTLIGQSMDILLNLNGEPANHGLPARPGGRIKRVTIGYNTSDTPHGTGENKTDPVTHIVTHTDHGLIEATHVDGLDVFFNHALVQIGVGNVGVLARGCTAVNVHDNDFDGALTDLQIL